MRCRSLLPPGTRPLAALLAALALAACGPEPEDYVPFADLTAGLPEARVRREPGRVDLGTPAARELLGRGWSVDEGEGEDTFVWSDGPESEVTFFLAAPRDLLLGLRGRPYTDPGAPEQAVTVIANGEEVGQVVIGRSGAERRLEVPASALEAGDNRLVLRYAWTRTPREVTGGANPDDRRLGVAWEALRFIGAEPTGEPRATKDLLYLPFGARLDLYVRLPAGSALIVDRLAARGEPGGTLAVSVQPADGDPSGARLEPREEPAVVELPDAGDGPRVARVSLAAVPESWPAGPDTGLVLARPRLAWPKAEEIEAAGPAAAEAPAPAAAGRRPNVILYLIDTLRRDRLGCYGYDLPVSPHLDAFARRGILFADAVAQSPWTRPSMASIMTGVWPRTHGVNDRRDALPEASLTLAEMLRAKGWRTAAFVTNGNVARAFGLAQGFDQYELQQQRRHGSQEVTASATAWLDAHAGDGRPFFLYLHTVDPHASYQPPEQFRTRFAPAVPRGEIGTRAWLKRLSRGRIPVTPGLVTDLLALYDAEVAANDDSFGRLVAELERRGLWDDTVVLVISDHGEEFHEHGRWQHGHSLHTELLDVPWIARFPGLPEGVRVEEIAQHIDLVPTLLAYLGLPAPPHLEGRNLLPFVEGARPPEDEPAETAAFSYVDLDGVRGAAVSTGGWRLIDARANPTGTALYDRRRDPAEHQSRAAERPIDREYLKARLEARERDRKGAMKAGEATLDEELTRQLKALGYLQ